MRETDAELIVAERSPGRPVAPVLDLTARRRMVSDARHTASHHLPNTGSPQLLAA
jgi:hypothetical protein